jgi:hypothetical protein
MDWFDDDRYKNNALDWFLRFMAAMIIVYPDNVVMGLRVIVGVSLILFTFREWMLQEKDQQEKIEHAAHYRGRGIGQKSPFLILKEEEARLKAKLQAEEQHKKAS